MATKREVDFYLYASHEIDTWLPIVRRLREIGIDARFVLERPGRNLARGSRPDPSAGWRDEKGRRDLLTPLVDGATFKVLSGALAVKGETPLDRRRLLASAVTTQGSRWLRVYAGSRIRTMYGVALAEDAYGHGSINSGFDLVLAHGTFSESAIHRCSRVPVVQVGFPKWASVRRGERDRDSARRALGLSDERRTVVLWAPTWAHNSSLDDADTHHLDQTTHLVILKPHHNTQRFEGARLRGLEQLGFRVVDATTSLVDLILAADVVVTDPRSGAFTEALLADRPCVALTPSGTETSLHEGVTDCAAVGHPPQELRELIDLAFDESLGLGRRAWTPRLFTDLEGHDDEVAARHIAAILRPRPSITRVVTSAVFSLLYTTRRMMGR